MAFIEKEWNGIKVGDIVRVEGGDFLPADLVLLSSSEPEGLCYIETSNLDGETNLKIKQATTETAILVTPQQISQLNGYIKSESPNNSLYTYDGILIMNGPNGSKQGAQLKNTPWIYGVVIFTGHETKLMRNASATPIKRTSVEKMVNIQIIFLFGILLTMSLACSIGSAARTVIVKFQQAALINSDLDMYYEKTDTPALCRTSSLVEELGQ
ncbi:14284_t:CDS:2, partial [Entrophospora sp. SA101]